MRAIDASIRAAALALFLEAGYDAATMDAVALRAQVSKGTLYARYASKEQLFRALVEAELEQLSAVASRNNHLLPDDLGPRLRHHANTIARMYAMPQLGALARLRGPVRGTFPDLERLWREIGTERYLAHLVGSIAQTPQGRHFGAEDARFHASLFLFAVGGWLEARPSFPGDEDPALTAYVDRVIGMIVTAADSAGAGPSR